MKKALCILLGAAMILSICSLSWAEEDKTEPKGIVMEGQEYVTVDGITLGSEDARKLSILDAGIAGSKNAVVVQQDKEYEEAAAIEAFKATLATEIQPKGPSENIDDDAAFAEYVQGSVILIKSSTVDIELEKTEILPDNSGSGNLIHTVVNDREYTVGKPEKQIPEINVSMEFMKAEGNIVHEDYMRNLNLELTSSELTGAVNGFDSEHWLNIAQEKGFEEYIPDILENTDSGVSLTLKKNSIWTVTDNSSLKQLVIEPGSAVKGTITVNGEEIANKSGSYEGKIEIVPSEDVTEVEVDQAIPAADQDTSETEEAKEEESTADDSTVSTGHEQATTSSNADDCSHEWERSGGSAPSCAETGTKIYICKKCGVKYTEEVPATGHMWVEIAEVASTCKDEGYIEYKCDFCQDQYIQWLPTLAHNWVLTGSEAASCEEPGYDEYMCSECNSLRQQFCDNEGMWLYEPTGHIIDYIPYPADPGSGHVLFCNRCGKVLGEDSFSYHEGNPCYYCDWVADFE